MRRGWLALAAAAALSSTHGSAQPAGQPARLEARAGINLPPQLCAMRQERRDSRPGSLYALYSLSGGASLRIHIDRASQSPGGEFNDTERAIRGVFSDIVLLRELAAPPGVPEARGRLWRGALDGMRLMTGLWLWHHDGLRIKLRGNVPLGEGERLWPEIECAVRALSAPAQA